MKDKTRKHLVGKELRMESIGLLKVMTKHCPILYMGLILSLTGKGDADALILPLGCFHSDTSQKGLFLLTIALQEVSNQPS